MSSAEDDPQATKTASAARSRIIAHAAERTHEARRRYISASNTQGSGGEEAVAAVALHNAVIEYYFALAPLSDKGPVRKFWECAKLWQETQVVKDDHGRIRYDPEWVRGFDKLASEAINARTVREESDGYLGTRIETKEVPERLPPDVLLQVSAKLDQAATRLGFAPDVDEAVIDTILEERDDEVMEELKKGDSDGGGE